MRQEREPPRRLPLFLYLCRNERKRYNIIYFKNQILAVPCFFPDDDSRTIEFFPFLLDVACVGGVTVSGKHYLWKRFWVPFGKEVPYNFDGFLYDPEEKWGNIYARELTTLDTLDDSPALFLLGESGMGKTTVLEEEQRRLCGKCGTGPSPRVIYKNLRDMDTSQWLTEYIFGSEEFRSWKCSSSGELLFLLLDSLDESQLGPTRALSNLIEKLKEYPPERLRLRLTCRTAEWPYEVSSPNNIGKIWKSADESISPDFLELAPLRKKDVIEAAEISEIDANPFFREIERLEAVSLASRPITLNMLLDIFREDGALPGTRRAVFESGCRLLCTEEDRTRRENRHFSSNQLFVAAARLAFFSRLSGHDTISFSSREDEGRALSCEDLCWGSETADGQTFDVTERVFSEARLTGLFSADADDTIVFAHQSYADFLAAWYLDYRKTPAPQLLNILLHPASHAVVPRLREMTAWLASMRQDLFPEILDRDPLLLVEADTLAPDQRERLARHLLENVRWQGIPWERARNLRSSLENLECPNLAEILRPFLTGEHPCSDEQMGLVLDIARECRLSVLVPELIRMTEECEQKYALRIEAAYALMAIDTGESRRGLRPFLNDRPDDPDREMKGVALRALWPDHLSAGELFPLLTLPVTRLFGAYRHFLSLLPIVSKFTKKEDYLVGLRWMTSPELFPTKNDYDRPFDKIMDDLVEKSVPFLTDPEIAAAYAGALLRRYRSEYRLFSDEKMCDALKSELSADVCGVKRILTSSLAETAGDDDRLGLLKIPYLLGLIGREDLSWLIEQARAAHKRTDRHIERIVKNWTRFVRYASDLSLPDHVALLLDACDEMKELAAEFPWLMDRKGRPPEEISREHRSQQGLDSFEKEEVAPLQPSPKERVLICLGRIESGEPNFWSQLNLEMPLNPSDHPDRDLTQSLGWLEADESVRSRIVAAAKTFVYNGALPERNLGTKTYNEDELSVGRAFFLLGKQRTGDIESFSSEIWEKWLPFLLDGSFYENASEGDEESAIIDRIIRTGYEKAPEACREIWDILLRKQEGNHCSPDLEQQLRLCWGEPLRAFLMRHVEDDELPIASFDAALSLLLEHGDPEAASFVEDLVRPPAPDDAKLRKRIIVAANALMGHPEPRNWTIFRSLLENSPGLGEEAVLMIAYRREPLFPFLSSRTPRELADFFRWLNEHFPYKGDPAHEAGTAHEVMPRDKAAELRDRTLNVLVSFGTQEAVFELEKLKKDLPDLPFLERSLAIARETTCAKTWVPPSPSEIRSFLERTDRRFVNSDGQLLEVLLESLQRMEDVLQGETALAILLWNEETENSNSQFWPKPEKRYADTVKKYLEFNLKQSGIIVNREVEVRPTTTPDSGERVDLYVHNVASGHSGSCLTYRVVIEVKGSWNSGVKTAMKTQLAEGYLSDSHSRCGIYLVGWFDCDPACFKDRNRKRPRVGTSIEEARGALKRQAEELSASGERTIRAFVMDVRLK